MRVGFGYDVHRFSSSRPLILGGVTIPSELGLEGHSDADVLTHAVIDALLGAMAWGDIGSWFPDTDPEYKNADSLKLLRTVIQELKKQSVSIMNIDTTIVAEKPKLRPYIDQIRNSLAEGLNIETSKVSVKATTSEKMGFVGRVEGIAVHSVSLVSQ